MKKTAIITGGSRGIGYAIAERLGAEDCQVVILATGEQSRCQAALDNLSGKGIDWLYVQGSIDSQESRENLVKKTVERFGWIENPYSNIKLLRKKVNKQQEKIKKITRDRKKEVEKGYPKEKKDVQ